MSVLIKGMEIPEAGEHVLVLYVYHDGTASIIGDHRHYKNEPFEIVPVPPHGRLIDADELRSDWLEYGENEYVYDTNAILDSIDAAPTIIPASEEGE